jgi:hypothetical protein
VDVDARIRLGLDDVEANSVRAQDFPEPIVDAEAFSEGKLGSGPGAGNGIGVTMVTSFLRIASQKRENSRTVSSAEL